MRPRLHCPWRKSTTSGLAPLSKTQISQSLIQRPRRLVRMHFDHLTRLPEVASE